MATEDQNPEATNREEMAEEHSFDILAKGLADGSVSRGKALKWMGAAVIGGMLASIPGVALADHKLSHSGGGGNRPANPGGNRGCAPPKIRVGGKCECPNTCTGLTVQNPTTCACECPEDLISSCSYSGGTANPSNNCFCDCPSGIAACGFRCCRAGETCDPSSGFCVSQPAPPPAVCGAHNGVLQGTLAASTLLEAQAKWVMGSAVHSTDSVVSYSMLR